ncbi:hypothetical protein [Lactiplantibacillus carotarum]|uniref:hypothetical protein n=1 Tax=Lactiplantibacillus carotarum TaxID=2993456 RepID=UPI00298EE158|nr:hypothetical protein [Lactiplantibacillus carotarum]
MKKVFKLGLLVMASLALVVAGSTTNADAAGKVKVLSTKTVAKRAYHGKSGNIYSSAKLTHRKYQLKKYKYTTWYAYKQSVIKQSGKKRTYVYIKSGKKAGWIYKKSLKAGKAPVNKQARLLTTYTKFNQIARKADKNIRTDLAVNTLDYETMGESILTAYQSIDTYNMSVNNLNRDRTALLEFNNLFKNRFNINTQHNLAVMANDLKKRTITNDNLENTLQQMDSMASVLDSAIGAL